MFFQAKGLAFGKTKSGFCKNFCRYGVWTLYKRKICCKRGRVVQHTWLRRENLPAWGRKYHCRSRDKPRRTPRYGIRTRCRQRKRACFGRIVACWPQGEMGLDTAGIWRQHMGKRRDFRHKRGGRHTMGNETRYGKGTDSLSSWLLAVFHRRRAEGVRFTVLYGKNAGFYAGQKHCWDGWQWICGLCKYTGSANTLLCSVSPFQGANNGLFHTFSKVS